MGGTKLPCPRKPKKDEFWSTYFDFFPVFHSLLKKIFTAVLSECSLPFPKFDSSSRKRKNLVPPVSSQKQQRSVSGADPASSPSAAKWGDRSHDSGNDNMALVCTGSINILKVVLHALNSCKKSGFWLQSLLILKKLKVPYHCYATVPACLRKRCGSGPKSIQASHVRVRGNLAMEAKSWALKGPIHPLPITEGTPCRATTFSKPAGSSLDGVQKGYRLPPIGPAKP